MPLRLRSVSEIPPKLRVKGKERYSYRQINADLSIRAMLSKINRVFFFLSIDNFSIFTSWALSTRVADYHANKDEPGGIVLQKTTSLSRTVPSPDNFHELEVLIPGIVVGAKVTTPKGPGGRSAY